MVQNRFRSGINRAKTRTFPGADVGSDHDLVIMNFKTRLKKAKAPKYTRVKYNLDKLKDPTIRESFQASIGGKFAPLLLLEDDAEDAEALTTKFNLVMNEAAQEVLGKQRHKNKRWITDDILALCDQRRELKKAKHTRRGADEYRSISKKIRKEMKKAKQKWIEDQCREIEESHSRNNSKKAYTLVKDLTKPKMAKVCTIQNKEGMCLTDEEAILKRWTEYCAELFNHQAQGDPSVLNTTESSNEDDFPILRAEVEAAIKHL